MLFLSNSIKDDSRLHLNLLHRKSVFIEKSSAFCTLHRVRRSCDRASWQISIIIGSFRCIVYVCLHCILGIHCLCVFIIVHNTNKSACKSDRFVNFRSIYLAWYYFSDFLNILYKFLIIKPTRCTISQIYFGKKLYMFRTLPLSIIRSFPLYTQQWYMSYKLADSFQAWVPSWSCLQTVSKPVWHIPLLCVQWKTPDDGQRKCPKHVEFLSKINFRN